MLNLVLAVCGLAIVGYSVYVFGEWNRNGAIKSSTPWCAHVWFASTHPAIVGTIVAYPLQAQCVSAKVKEAE